MSGMISSVCLEASREDPKCLQDGSGVMGDLRNEEIGGELLLEL